jgi:hypothetical protein
MLFRYDSYQEFEALKDRIVLLFCDDTRAFKCRRLFEHLSTSPEWRVLINQPNDRHGWAVFVKKSQAHLYEGL